MRVRLALGKRVIRACTVSLVLGLASCKKEAPPDPHLAKGYSLLGTSPEQALQEFDQARLPDSPETLLGRGLALEGLRRYAEAETVLEKVKAKWEEAGVLLVLARVNVMLGKKKEAERYIDRVVILAPSDLTGLLLETCLALDGKRAERALHHLDVWARQSSLAAPTGRQTAPAEYHLTRASLLGQLGQPSERRKEMFAAQASLISGIDGALALSMLAMQTGRNDLASSLLERLLPEVKATAQLRQVAELAHRLGNRKITQQVLSILPDGDADLLRLRARHEIATRASGMAASTHRALKVTDDPQMRIGLRVSLSEALLQSGQLAAARKEAEALLLEQPDLPGAQLLLAHLDLAEGQPEQALIRVQPLLLGEPMVGAREMAALAQVQAGRPKEALPFLLQLLKQEPVHHTAARMLVAIEREAGYRNQAIALLSELVRRAPQDSELRLIWLQLLVKEEPPARVLEALRQAVEAMPHQTSFWMQLAQHHHRQKEPNEALAVLQEAQQKNPRDPLIAAALAAELTSRGRSTEAAPLYATVLEYSQNDIVALNNLATFHIDELHDVARGIELAEKAYRLAPQAAAITDTLGWALYHRGSPQDLKRAEELLVYAQPQLSTPSASYHLGAVLIALGKAEEGKSLLRQALASAAGFPEAVQARELLGRGS